MNIQYGKLIVIDGTDGSGKTVQTNLLVEKLRAYGYGVELIDFPQYGKKSAGLVEEYLNGKYGSAEEVGPYLASVFYAVDRYDASFQIKKWLNEEKIVISNRYVTANMGHQGGKIKDREERKKYFDWLDKLEYKLFGIPKPDLNIILHVPAEVAQILVDKKESRKYINGEKRDLHEADLNHLKNAEKIYLEIANAFSGFALIECTKGDYLMTPAEINDLIWNDVIKLVGHSDVKATFKIGTFYKSLISNENKKINNESRILTAPDFKKIHDILEAENKKTEIENCKLKIENLLVERLSSSAKLPTRAHLSDAGLDLCAADNYSILAGEKTLISTGIKMAIPEGFAGFIWDKSGLAREGLHTMAGVIDSSYRGEILVNVINLSQDIINIARGQKIAQIIIQKIELPEIKETKINDETDRGDEGFGSSGLF